MENVRFICMRNINGRSNEYVFKIADGIADCIREYSKYSEEGLRGQLTDDNEYLFRIGSLWGEKPPELSDIVIETIERISNNYSEAEFWNNILTDNGKRRYISEVHDLMKTEYGLDDEDVEWWVGHFFNGLSSLIFSYEID